MQSEIRTRTADFRPSSFDEKAGTVDVVLSTGADARVRDAQGVYLERLDVAGLRLRSPCPVLVGHNHGGLPVGTVTAVRLESTTLIGTIRLSNAADAKPVVDRIREGLLPYVSIGYRVEKHSDAAANGIRLRTVHAAEIQEVSFVNLPADAGARVRNENMPDDVQTPTTTAADVDRIRSLGELADLPPSWAEGQIAAGHDLDAARAAAREELSRRTAPVVRTAAPLGDDPALRLRAFEEALCARVDGSNPSDLARPHMELSLRDMARAMLQARGISTAGMDSDMLFRAAMHTTSDFPNLLTGVGSRTLMPAYTAAASPLRSLCRPATRTDFRVPTKLRLGDLDVLQKVGEAGEIKSQTRGEATESFAIDTYASTFSLSRKAWINDDLGAFRDWSTAAGRAAAQTEAALIASLLAQSSGAGPVMGEDSKRLFSADHGNLASSGTALDETNLSAARLALRGMKSLGGKVFINAVPKYLLVGPQLETTAEKLLTAINAATTDNVNPFAGKLTLLVEPRITTKAWYVFCDPSTLPVLEYAYLSSARGPQMSSREGWDVLGVEFRVVLDFGCGAIDWRGAYRNPGL